MPVSADKKPIVLVVHGVQLGEDKDLNQDESIKELVMSRLAGTYFDFDVDLYCYENLNDQVQGKFKALSSLIMSSPVGGVLAKNVIDIVGDVVTSLADSSTANKIREGLKEKILSYYELGHPVYIVAHSLGTVYTFDVVNQLIADKAYFDRNNPLLWPVQGMITIGSPLGLAMFKATGRKTAKNLGAGNFNFKWLNYFDINDPVVSGNIFGKSLANTKIAEKYKKEDKNFGWFIRDFPVDTGKTWLLAHVAYWDSALVGDGLVNMMV
jgi:hypothetical protein